jgi:predicted nucleotide-binding protein (sugar kinase/HSP70/actin superfamily)
LYGQAWAVGKWTKKDIAKRQLHIREKTHPSVALDGDIYFLVIQINKGAIRMITRRGLRYLLAHELAHILQICIDEEVDCGYSYSTEADHDEKWTRYAKWMGGTGSELIPFKEIWV